VNDSVQAAEDEGRRKVDGLSFGWHIASAQLLYRRNAVSAKPAEIQSYFRLFVNMSLLFSKYTI